MSAQSIYFKLVEAGMSPVGACAMLGNMQDESGMKANNVQNGMGYTDEDYTAAVDAGAIDFVSDQRGYGLCQWTYSTRKLNLLQFARSRGVSVGNEDMQVDFCIWELRTEYPVLWLYLCDATGVAEAAERVCREYERPAETNVNSRERAQFANGFYMQFGGMEGETIPQSPAETAPFTQGSLDVEKIYWPPRTLALGMYGPDVVALQGLLIAHGFPAGVSGTFDNATRIKTMGFQVEHGLYGDGIAGPLTWAALTKR